MYGPSNGIKCICLFVCLFIFIILIILYNTLIILLTVDLPMLKILHTHFLYTFNMLYHLQFIYCCQLCCLEPLPLPGVVGVILIAHNVNNV